MFALQALFRAQPGEALRALAFGFLFASAGINCWFALQFGFGWWTSGLIAAFGTLMEFAAFFMIAAAWDSARQRGWLRVGVCTTAWVLCMGVSFASALYFIGMSRLETASARFSNADARGALLQERNRLQQLVAWSPEVATGRTPEAIEKELAAQRQHRRWTATSECTDATVPASRAFCTRYNQLEADLAGLLGSLEAEAALKATMAKLEANGGGELVHTNSGDIRQAADTGSFMLASLYEATERPSDRGIYWSSMTMIMWIIAAITLLPSVTHFIGHSLSDPADDAANSSRERQTDVNVADLQAAGNALQALMPRSEPKSETPAATGRVFALTA